jgi:hypothetical protein
MKMFVFAIAFTFAMLLIGMLFGGWLLQFVQTDSQQHQEQAWKHFIEAENLLYDKDPDLCEQVLHKLAQATTEAPLSTVKFINDDYKCMEHNRHHLQYSLTDQ